MSRRPVIAVLAAALLGSGLAVVTVPVAEAAHSHATVTAVTKALPKPRAYKNCTELRKVYPHGVGRVGARDRVSGKSKPVTNWTRDTATYNLNKKSDRDQGGPDGIACEK